MLKVCIMNSPKNQKGNFLTFMLGLILFSVTLLIGVMILAHPVLSISAPRNDELNTMIEDVRNTSLQPLFNSKVNQAMQDGKITNNEFFELENIYKGYKTSKLTGSDQQYISKIQADDKRKIQEMNDAKTKSILPDNKFILYFASFIGLIFVVIFCNQVIKAQRP